MAGDKIHTKIDYYYNVVNSNNSSANALTSIVASLISSFGNVSAPSVLLKNEASALTSQLSANSAFTSMIEPAPSTSGGNSAPKAYLYILFFDERFVFDAGSSSVTKVDYLVGSKGSIGKTFSNAVTAGKSGYVYVYFGNESNELVYFDNFMLSHERGPLLEETHYYPFGLTMAGISSKAAESLETNHKYNGIEQNKDFDLNLYDAFYRNLDPQIGRFWQIDPKLESTEAWSPYAAMLDNPVRYSDPLGDSVINKDAATKAAANANYVNKKTQYGATGNETKKQFKAAGHNIKEWRDFKNARKESNRADAAYNHTQASIDNFKRVDPTGFAKVNSLTYTDKSGTVHNLDVLVSSGTVTTVDKGQTIFDINPTTGRIADNVLNTTIDLNVSPSRNVLAHEFGHALGVASNPLAYFQAYRALANPDAYDCQTPTNWNNILTKDAINMQHNYDSRLKTYNQVGKILQNVLLHVGH